MIELTAPVRHTHRFYLGGQWVTPETTFTLLDGQPEGYGAPRCRRCPPPVSPC